MIDIKKEILKRATGGLSVVKLIDDMCRDYGLDRMDVTYAMWALVDENKLSYGTDAIVKTL